MRARFQFLRVAWLLPAVLSWTAGAMDVIGFLALGGLFTAHITGNLVIVAAHYITGGFSEVGPLLSVPVFIAVLGTLTVATKAAEKAGYGLRRPLLVLQSALLAICLGCGVRFGPFPDADCTMAVFVGMLAVAAMATQNALGKLTLSGTPPTAVMTSIMVQLTIDLATLVQQRGQGDDLGKVRHRVSPRFRASPGSWEVVQRERSWKSISAFRALAAAVRPRGSRRAARRTKKRCPDYELTLPRRPRGNRRIGKSYAARKGRPRHLL